MFIARDYRSAQSLPMAVVYTTGSIDTSWQAVELWLAMFAWGSALVLEGSCRIAELKCCRVELRLHAASAPHTTTTFTLTGAL
jgi:hypothetical protein